MGNPKADTDVGSCLLQKSVQWSGLAWSRTECSPVAHSCTQQLPFVAWNIRQGALGLLQAMGTGQCVDLARRGKGGAANGWGRQGIAPSSHGYEMALFADRTHNEEKIMEILWASV